MVEIKPMCEQKSHIQYGKAYYNVFTINLIDGGQI